MKYCLILLILLNIFNSFSLFAAENKFVFKAKSIYNGEVSVYETETNRIIIAESKQGAILQGHINLKDPSSADTDYLQLMSLLTSLHSKANAIYNLGLGGGGLVRTTLAKNPTVKITSAEIDPVIAQIAENYFKIKNSNHTVILGDGYQALENLGKKYDIIWTDTSTPKAGPQVSLKAEDLNTLKSNLSDSGIIVAYLGDAKSENQLTLIENEYKGTFSNGIRLKTFANLQNKILNSFSNQMKNSDALIIKNPIYFISVGNNKNLTCIEIEKKFIQSKQLKILINKTADFCRDL